MMRQGEEGEDASDRGKDEESEGWGRSDGDVLGEGMEGKEA